MAAAAPAPAEAPVEPANDGHAVVPLDRLRVLKSGRVRSRTVGRLSRAERAKAAAEGYPEDVERPRTRADCEGGPRPCPFVSCAYHLYLDASATGVKLNFPHLEVWDLKETCALDVADRGGATLEEVGQLVNLTRERVRQTEVSGLSRLARTALALTKG
jgi:hypothetical protein